MSIPAGRWHLLRVNMPRARVFRGLFLTPYAQSAPTQLRAGPTSTARVSSAAHDWNLYGLQCNGHKVTVCNVEPHVWREFSASRSARTRTLRADVEHHQMRDGQKNGARNYSITPAPSEKRKSARGTRHFAAHGLGKRCIARRR